MNGYESRRCLETIVAWWDNLPPRLRQDIEGSGAEPGGIAKARALCKEYAQQNAVNAGRYDTRPRS